MTEYETNERKADAFDWLASRGYLLERCGNKWHVIERCSDCVDGIIAIGESPLDSVERAMAIEGGT